MNSIMLYFKGKIRDLRNEYTGSDAKAIVKSKGGKCELCGRKKGDEYVFGPTHYIKKKILFKVDIHIHKIISDGEVYKVVICGGCHASYHLWTKLDGAATFGDKTIDSVRNSKRLPYGNPIVLAVKNKARGR